jgi:putative redox protein
VSATSVTRVDLRWAGELEFAANLSKTAMVIDSAGTAGPSPVELLAAALAGCMAADLVHILTRGRHDLTAARATLSGERAPSEPRRLTAVTLHFALEGTVPSEAVARAIELSRTKYCSVWASMRQDIDLQVTFDINA